MYAICKIQVLTVINERSVIAYQQVFVNDEKTAKAEYTRSLSLYLSVEGWTVTLNTF